MLFRLRIACLAIAATMLIAYLPSVYWHLTTPITADEALYAIQLLAESRYGKDSEMFCQAATNSNRIITAVDDGDTIYIAGPFRINASQGGF